NNRLLKLEKEFLKESPFKMISNNWHEPVDDPQIAMFTQGGNSTPQNNTFGKHRSSKTKLHAGLDLFALEGTNVYACLDAEVFETQEWVRTKGDSGYGHNFKN
ncbi:MAG: hypothetical protein JKY08_09910, partial [Flavobacteriaceae bacterium]|nr:hypothetical protein [Flavobacteriaceae bacterium]